MKPSIIEGKVNIDDRGKLFHINNFDLTPVKRIYIIENKTTNQYRGWKGHQIENRWFFCTKGSVEIQVVNIDFFSEKKDKIEIFNLSDQDLNILFVPKGFATLIKQNKNKSRVTAMSDYLINTSNDENLRWNSDFFIN